ncbi:MAG: hypothetical protein PHT62_06840 [Desulfotomaculaceae bacterium]|nr:hypothetical protein [Desulfotomaculaceae bacterium]
MGMSPREMEEKVLSRRRKIRERYYWSGMELRPKDSFGEEPGGGTGRKLWGLLRKLPKVMRSQN